MICVTTKVLVYNTEVSYMRDGHAFSKKKAAATGGTELRRR
jgi:hypothetical protein